MKDVTIEEILEWRVVRIDVSLLISPGMNALDSSFNHIVGEIHGHGHGHFKPCSSWWHPAQ